MNPRPTSGNVTAAGMNPRPTTSVGRGLVPRRSLPRRRAVSVRIPELDVDLPALAEAVRHVDAPEHVRVHEGAKPDPYRHLGAGERGVERAEDLPGSDERIDPPVGDDAEDVGLEEPDPLFELQRPRLPVDEA